MEFGDEFSYSHETLPDQQRIIETADWELLCVYDACRVDAFTQYWDCTPVLSPAINSEEWLRSVWLDSDSDWTDVTYVSGNPFTEKINGFEECVGSLIQADTDDDVWDDRLHTPLPSKIAEIAQAQDPPIVAHFMQPHAPFIGNVKYDINRTRDVDLVDLRPDEIKQNDVWHALNKCDGFVTKDFVRTAHVENMKFVWNQTESLRRSFSRVLATADHGESLAGHMWGHHQNVEPVRCVPLHTTWSCPAV